MLNRKGRIISGPLLFFFAETAHQAVINRNGEKNNPAGMPQPFIKAHNQVNNCNNDRVRERKPRVAALFFPAAVAVLWKPVATVAWVVAPQLFHNGRRGDFILGCQQRIKADAVKPGEQD